MNPGTNMHRIMSITMCIGFLMLSCMMGGSAEQGNARISGSLSSGSMSDSALNVFLVEEDFNPYDAGSGIVCSTKTDNAGKYKFENVPFGSYYLYAFDDEHGFVLLDGPYTISENESDLFGTILRRASVVTIIDSGSSDDTPARFFIKGTTVEKTLNSATPDLMKLTGVPAGVHDVMKHDLQSEQPQFFTRDIEILPGDSIMISQDNRPPRVIDASLQLPESVYVDTAYSLRIDATDPDSDEVIYSLITPLLTGTIDSTTGTLSWTPQPSESALSGIMIKVTDPHGAYSVFTWNLTVSGSRVTPAPSLVNVMETIYGYDTIRIENGQQITDTLYDTIPLNIRPISCSSIALYRFSCNSEVLTDWVSETSLHFVPDSAGTYEFRVEGWCDSANALPSGLSEPYTITVLPDLPPPEITGDTLYDPTAPDTPLMFQITNAPTPDGVPVLHRIKIYNRSLAGDYDSTSAIGTLLISETCADTESCTDTATLYFDTYTPWLSGKTISITLARPSDIYTLYVQAKISERDISNESIVTISPR